MATLRVPLPDIDRVMPLPRPERSTPATSATAPGPARPAWAQSPRVARLLLWYVLLLIPTLFFKYSYLRSVATDGLSATLASGPFGHLPGVVQYLLLFKGDLLEVLVIVLVAAILGTLLRIDLSWLVAATSFLAIAVSAANWLSFETAGALIARDNLHSRSRGSARTRSCCWRSRATGCSRWRADCSSCSPRCGHSQPFCSRGTPSPARARESSSGSWVRSSR